MLNKEQYARLLFCSPEDCFKLILHASLSETLKFMHFNYATYCDLRPPRIISISDCILTRLRFLYDRCCSVRLNVPGYKTESLSPFVRKCISQYGAPSKDFRPSPYSCNFSSVASAFRKDSGAPSQNSDPYGHLNRLIRIYTGYRCHKVLLNPSASGLIIC